MDSYVPLLEKTRLPQSSFQKSAVISIFAKLRSAPKYLDSESEPGRDAISQCLNSPSPAVVDQSVRELCRLVTDSHLDVSRGLLELQSALEGSGPLFVDLFVKCLGFLVRFGFQKNNGLWQFGSTESHPFDKVLSCRTEVQSELVRQVFLFLAGNKSSRMVKACEFLRPFLCYAILRTPFSDPSSALFVRRLILSMASFCCSLPEDGIPVLKLLIGSLVYLPCRTSEEFQNFTYLSESMADACIVVMRLLVGRGSHLATEAQLCGIELLDTILSLCTWPNRYPGGDDRIVELSKCVLSAQKDLGMRYTSGISRCVLSLLVIIMKSELEHQQLLVLKLLYFLLKWRGENEHMDNVASSGPREELLSIFPVISLLSSPSKSVKAAAIDLLAMLEKLLLKLLPEPEDELVVGRGFPQISTPGSIVFRLLQELWFQDPNLSSHFFFPEFSVSENVNSGEMHRSPRKSWISQIREYSLWTVNRRKSSLPLSKSSELFLSEMPFVISSMACILVMHKSLASGAVDLLASIGILDPKIGVPLLLTVLFYSNIFTKQDTVCNDMLVKLLEILPSLASHSAMIPIVVQTILPMLQKDAKPVLYATATRLLCQTWKNNDRAFGSLQGVLLPTAIAKFATQRDVSISLAASVRDVCQKNADRGVDLILSVSACIESQDPVIQSLGFQCLGHLCESDVIDFYTAWDVIGKHTQNYSANPLLAYGICLFLRWGAMDAEAYAEASKNILQTLWAVATSARPCQNSKWTVAQLSALEALKQYEVPHIERSIPDFKQQSTEILFSETNEDVLRAIEEFLVKIITYEHINRRRLVKEKRVVESKIEKLLDVFPQIIFFPGKRSNVKEMPGAALQCLSFTAKSGNNQGLSRGAKDDHKSYENALIGTAASLHLSRNIFVALLSLESWKSFMGRWIKADVFSLDAKEPANSLDKTCKAGNSILKSMMRIAEEALPRSAENIALAIGALCVVLPSSAHAVRATAAKFLLNWLRQHEHEYRQWAAAISLGLISSCLHVTDRKLKFQSICGLVEVLNCSRSTLVKGACGIGLSLSSQDLLVRVANVDASNVDNQADDRDLVGTIVRTLSLMICQLTKSSSEALESLFSYFPRGSFNEETDASAEMLYENHDELDEDLWGIAGLILSLANTVGAIYRAGAYDAVVKIKDLIISWIPRATFSIQNSGSGSEGSEMLLSVGSCLSLPIVVAFCRRVELMDNDELDHLLNDYKELISELVSISKSSFLHQSLLMASCIGAGNLLACVLNEGVHSVEVEFVMELLELFRKCYSNPYPSLVHFGGMLGVVNSMGAAAGNLISLRPVTSSLQIKHDLKESSRVMAPLLSSAACEPKLTSMMQEIFLAAQNSNNNQTQQYSAWALSFLRQHLWSRKFPNDNVTRSKSVSKSFTEGSVVMMLCTWLMQMNLSENRRIAHVHTIATAIRCLSQSPRLPVIDWGAIIRRCMRVEDQAGEFLPAAPAVKTGILREECLKFSLAHANQHDPLLTFLDELSELSRFKTLELNLQTCLFFHLADLVKVFSGSRIEKLFDDVANFFTSASSHRVYSDYEEHLLRSSCWKGLYQCLHETSLDSLEYVSNIEKCMDVLFHLLPSLQSSDKLKSDEINLEWSAAVRCLGKARQQWTLDLLQVLPENLELKKVQARAKLVKAGSLPLSEMGRVKSQLLNSRSEGTWDVLIEVVAALQLGEGSVKRQWLVDATEISCVSRYPSTALQFLGLLAGSCCKYMPLLILDPHAVLNDLPLSLSCLLSDSSWGGVSERVASGLFASTERIFNWVKCMSNGFTEPGLQPIDESENDEVVSLFHVMHTACVYLKDYFPLEKQLRLANMCLQ